MAKREPYSIRPGTASHRLVTVTEGLDAVSLSKLAELCEWRNETESEIFNEALSGLIGRLHACEKWAIKTRLGKPMEARLPKGAPATVRAAMVVARRKAEGGK